MLEQLSDMPDVVSMLVSAAAVYGAIRADLLTMKKSLDRAHERLDQHINDHARGEFKNAK